ncbi:MAG TPA: hypothetical protein VN648_03735, partial [Candidatus Methylomirabilis sp.]|nr:hypothetical protein [Candidatus Methylomirabilis sp.]
MPLVACPPVREGLGHWWASHQCHPEGVSAFIDDGSAALRIPGTRSPGLSIVVDDGPACAGLTSNLQQERTIPTMSSAQRIE